MTNEKIKVVLADSNINFCDIVISYLREQEDIDIMYTACDGTDAYEKIILSKPSVAIFDVVMPGLDGLRILEKLKNKKQRPVCIILSNVSTEIIIKEALELGAEYYMLKPFELSALTDRIRLLGTAAQCKNSSFLNICGDIPHSAPNIDVKITDILHKIGMPAHLLGYQYIRDAVRITITDTDILHHVTKELYPAIAKNYNTTSQRVERALRHAAEVVCRHSGQDIFNYLYGDTINKSKITSTELISIITDKLKLET